MVKGIVRLNWDPVNDTKYYEVQRATKRNFSKNIFIRGLKTLNHSVDFSWKKLGKTTHPTFDDPTADKSQEYMYRIRSVGHKGKKSRWTYHEVQPPTETDDEGAVPYKKNIPLKIPSKFTGTNDENNKKIDLQWEYA